MDTAPPKNSRGSSARERAPITIEVGPDKLAAVDDWIEEDGGRSDRSEALRALVDHAFGRTVASRGVRPLPPLLRSIDDCDPPA
jgi:hypothetical protein